MLKKLIKAKLQKRRLILTIFTLEGKAENAPPVINYTNHLITSYKNIGIRDAKPSAMIAIL